MPTNENFLTCLTENRANKNSLDFRSFQVTTKESQMKTLDVFYLVIYWTQKVHNDFIFVCGLHSL